jgi:hypothetical protein
MEHLEKYVIKKHSNEMIKRKLYRFPNGYGASVVYSKEFALTRTGGWEIAVLRFASSQENDKFYIVDHHGVCPGGIFEVREEEIEGVLDFIAAL